MTQPAPTDAANDPAPRHRRKRELIYGGIAAVLGFLVLPLAIFMVGTLLLGPYAGGQSLGVFLGDFYGHLAQGAPRTWFIALSPYVALWVLRLCFMRYDFGRFKGGKSPEPPANGAAAQPPATGGRREPFISS